MVCQNWFSCVYSSLDSQLHSQAKREWSNFYYFRIMVRHGNGDGNGWKIGLCFICFGIVGVMSMGVFSLIYHWGGRGE